MSAPTAPEAQASPPNLATPRYPLLDSLRGVAALTVFGAHAFLFLFAEGIGRDSPLVTRLDPGIAIFLLLSAFLLYRPFAQARLDGTEPPATVPFFIRRLLRIVPVYWVVLTVVALYFGFSYVAAPGGVVTFYGFLQIYDVENITRGVGQAWTICVEMTFYLLLPVWAWALRRVPAGTTKQFVRSSSRSGRGVPRVGGVEVVDLRHRRGAPGDRDRKDARRPLHAAGLHGRVDGRHGPGRGERGRRQAQRRRPPSNV